MPTTKTTEHALQDQLIDTIESAQTMVVDGVSTLTDRVAGFKADEVPDPKAVWTSSFEFVEKMIDSQKKFGMALLDSFTTESTEEAV
jgi:hypothetical protein